MEAQGAYGGGKAGGAFDPQAFIQRPPVIVRAVCWGQSSSLGVVAGRLPGILSTPCPAVTMTATVIRNSGAAGDWGPGLYIILTTLGGGLLFCVIVMGCISAKGWYTNKDNKEYCVYNNDTNACNYGVGISVIAFIASIGFIVGEYLFEQMSSVKTRKHYVLADMGFSALWAFLYFVGFCYLSNAWGKTENPPVGTANNMQGAIAFCFFSIFPWVACAFFAFQRYRVGADAAFAPAYEVENAVGSPGGFPSYPGAPDPMPAYSEPPFSQQNTGNIDYTAPTY